MVFGFVNIKDYPEIKILFIDQNLKFLNLMFKNGIWVIIFQELKLGLVLGK